MESQRVIDVVSEQGTLLCTLDVPEGERGLSAEEVIVSACSTLPGDIVASTMALLNYDRDFVFSGTRVVLGSVKGHKRTVRESTFAEVTTRDGEVIQVARDHLNVETVCAMLHRRPEDWELDGQNMLTLTGEARLRAVTAPKGDITVHMETWNASHVLKHISTTGVSAHEVKCLAVNYFKVPEERFVLDKKWYYPGDVAYLRELKK